MFLSLSSKTNAHARQGQHKKKVLQSGFNEKRIYYTAVVLGYISFILIYLINWQGCVSYLHMYPLPSQAQGSLSSDELRVHLSVPSDNVVINNTHSYSSRYQRIHTFPDDRDHEREGEGEYQEPSALLRPRDYRDSTGKP